MSGSLRGVGRKSAPTAHFAAIAFLACALGLRLMIAEMPGIGSNYPTNSLIYNGDIQSTVKVDFLNVAFRGSQNQSEATVFDAEAYSGSWWTSVSNFLRYEEVEETFGSREGASFELFGANRDKVRMTKDWLDFSAEHLSMWWKLVASSPQSIDKAIGIMTNYTLSRAKPGPGLKVPQETLVVVSYQERSNKELSKWSLAATISSHAAASMGRIVVSGVLEEEKDLVEKVFDVIRSQFEPNPPELSFCLALNETTGDNGFVNINRTSLKKLRFVLLGKNVTEADVQCWLGDTKVVKTPEAKEYEPIMQSKWNYVYFTESDLLVTTRQYSLIALGQKLMDGFVLAPHRLQPLPHGSDFDDTDIRRIIPATGFFEHVQDIDSTVMSCCDAGRFKPMSVFEKPSTWWWQDGYGKTSAPEYAHHRLIPYGLMRLTKGSNLVYFCGSEHGRMCRPNYGIGLCP